MTLAEAQSMLTAAKAAYLKALPAVAGGYGDKSVRRQELTDLQAAVEYWEGRVKTLEAAAAGATNPGVRIATWT